MNRFYEPDLTANPDNPFVRDASNKLVRQNYWMDMPDRTLVTVMTQGIGAIATGTSIRKLEATVILPQPQHPARNLE